MISRIVHTIGRIAAVVAMASLSCVVTVRAQVVSDVPMDARQYDVTDDIINAINDITGDTLTFTSTDTIPVAAPYRKYAVYNEWVERSVEYNPDPTRAVWMSALCPGLGQVYNRRYWKLPIVVGGYMGLAYATSWNNTMLADYTKAYRDIMDTDPTTNSYMDLFPPTVNEADLDKAWLTRILQSRRNYFRRNRDLCIICMVGVYLLAMVDAYVDASLAHFDISSDLSINWAPTLMQDGRGQRPSVGLMWALNF